MKNRHEKLGIKQTIQKNWMDYAVKMILAGMKESEIRAELDEFLAKEKPYTGDVPKTHSFIKAILSSWFSPDQDLIPFRDHALELIKNENSLNWLPYHWAIISVSYPFWFNLAKQVGRLFSLQDQITQTQILSRIKEQYGDRETVARNAKYAIRSFVAWGVLKDSQFKGCYEKCKSLEINNPNLTMLLYEAALHTEKEGKLTIELLKNNPAFFPFQLPVLTGDYISQNSKNIGVVRYGLDDELLKLSDKSLMWNGL